jgi:hypothetical protein
MGRVARELVSAGNVSGRLRIRTSCVLTSKVNGLYSTAISRHEPAIAARRQLERGRLFSHTTPRGFRNHFYSVGPNHQTVEAKLM